MAGERNTEDLNRLFLGQRERFHYRQAFLEIGDFVAHRDMRVKGLASQRVKDWYRVLRHIFLPKLDRAPRPTAKELSAALPSALRLTSDTQLQTALGLKRAVAQSVLGSIVKAQLGQVRRLTDREAALLDTLTSYWCIHPIFSSAELLADFKYVLLRNKLISEAEQDSLDAAADFLALFAMSQMHGCQLALPDGGVTEAIAGPAGEGEMSVTCFLPGGPPTHVSFGMPLLAVGLPAAQHCTARLRERGRWDGPIELRDGQLDLV